MTCCGKRAYNTQAEAREEVRRRGSRILRAYRCDGGAWHVTGIHEKEYQGRRRVPLGLAPVRTLEEVTALAAEKRARYAG